MSSNNTSSPITDLEFVEIPKTFIRNVGIQLRNGYSLSNVPDEPSSPGTTTINPPSIGRKALRAKFLNLLTSGANRGCYLVTGYRGMGKTSFVNRVINDLEDDSKGKTGAPKIKRISLTVTQKNPREVDLLRQIVAAVYDKCKEHSGVTESEKSKREAGREYTWWKRESVPYILLGLLILPVIIFPGFIKDFLVNDNPLPVSIKNGFSLIKWACYLVAVVVLPVLMVKLYYLLRYKINVLNALENKTGELFYRVKNLMDRTFSAITFEQALSANNGFEFKGLGFSTGNTQRNEKNYPLANSKEIEYELKEILKLAKKEQLRFIFIFDELDKVEWPESGADPVGAAEQQPSALKEGNLRDELRQKKRTVLEIIAGLKNFLTTADAEFIFIAGREMFDASLADVADRQSYISSLFNFTFNIESLLKEEGDKPGEKNTTSLTNAIEEFVKIQLLEKDEYDDYLGNKTNDAFFENLYQYVNRRLMLAFPSCMELDKIKEKYYYLLQAFVTYIAYRSNGSPKKMIRVFQDFVVVGNRADFANKAVIINGDPGEEDKPRCYLYFNYHNQYRVGFVNYIYFPYLLENARNHKLYSENAIISVHYLFDHLVRFHPFAFSRSNLELVPELLSVNKMPTIKQDLDQIIRYLSNTHIRDTDVELFSYKFYSKSLNEIVFLSRIFEEESAAFNFTLDESYSIKLLLTDKIRALRNAYSLNEPAGSAGNQIYSIAYHNGNLGDLYFFDQEFDDAIASYSDAIRSLQQVPPSELTVQEILTLVRNKLKIGLCFEKISAFEDALAFYADAASITRQFLIERLNSKTGAGNSNGTPLPNYSTSLNDLLQTMLQCFLAKIFIQEKMGLEGMTNAKVAVTLGVFLRLTDNTAVDLGRNSLLVANALFYFAKLLYYKNTSELTTEPTGKQKDFCYPEWMEKRLKLLKSCMAGSTRNKFRQPVMAFRYYLLALDEVIRSRNSAMLPTGFQTNQTGNMVFDCNAKVNPLPAYFKAITGFISNGYVQKGHVYTAYHYKYMAALLSALGDCILGSHDLRISSLKGPRGLNKNNFAKLNFFEIFTNFRKGNDSNKLFLDCIGESASDCFSLPDVLRCYYLSAQLYVVYGRYTSASFQYRKIIRLLGIVLGKQASDVVACKVEHLIKTEIVTPAIELAGKCSGRTDYQMKAVASSYDIDDYSNIASHPDTREILMAFEILKLKIFHKPPTLPAWISPYTMISMQYIRMMELEYYGRHLYDSYLAEKPAFKVSSEALRSYYVEYFYSYYTILRVLKVYGTDYMMGYSFNGRIHLWLAQTAKRIAKNTAACISIKEKLVYLLGSGQQHFLDYKFHASMAIDYFDKAVQLHTAGMEYRRTVKDMIYLEDDFNDNGYHFGAALERYILTKGVFEAEQEELRKHYF